MGLWNLLQNSISELTMARLATALGFSLHLEMLRKKQVKKINFSS